MIKKGLIIFGKLKLNKEKEECKKDLEERNAARYEEDKEMWEITNGINRLRVMSIKPGKKPVFRHNEETGAYVLKEGKRGINWY
jgi:hypothetical protein